MLISRSIRCRFTLNFPEENRSIRGRTKIHKQSKIINFFFHSE